GCGHRSSSPLQLKAVYAISDSASAPPVLEKAFGSSASLLAPCGSRVTDNSNMATSLDWKRYCHDDRITYAEKRVAMSYAPVVLSASSRLPTKTRQYQRGASAASFLSRS